MTIRSLRPGACFFKASFFIFAMLFSLLGTLQAQYFALVESGRLCARQPGWADGDVGSGGLSGTANYTNGTYTVSGSGTQIYGTTDTFHFVYRRLSGDGIVVARVASVQGGSGYSAAGVMIRETLDAESPNAKIAAWPSYGAFYFDDRTTTGGSTGEPGSVSVALPYWVKLVRDGGSFRGYVSSDGVNWTVVASQAISMAQNVYVGLVVTSGSNSSLATATFDNVYVSSLGASPAPLPCIASVSATTAAIGSQVLITGSGFGASQGSSVVTLNGTPVTINYWSAASIIITTPEAATSGPLIVYVAPNLSNSVRLAITSQPLPSEWLDADVGSVVFGAAGGGSGSAVLGTANCTSETFSLSGSGTQIYGSSDTFHFAYKRLSADGSIVARVVSVPVGAVAGVMIRETLDAGSKNAKTALWVPYGTVVAFDVRTDTNGNSSEPGSEGGTPAPYWVKLVRGGSAFTSYGSPDGVNWKQLGPSQAINMAQNAYVGLAVTSGTNSALASATFDNVSVSSSSTPAPVITNLSATTGDIGSQVVITGSSFGPSQGSSDVRLNGTPVTVNFWSDTSISITIPSGATSGLVVVSVAPSMDASNPVSFTVTSEPLPPGWLDADLGVLGLGVVGNATYASGTFTVNGSGTQIYGVADSFHFAYRQLSGDGSIVARVLSVPVGGAGAGVMIRETIEAGSANGKTADWTPGGSYTAFDVRTTTGGNTSEPGAVGGTTPPYWVKMVRSGNTFSSYASPDGVNWTQLGTGQTINMAQNGYAGLAVTSGTNSALASAVFDNVTVVSSAQPPTVDSISPTGGATGDSVTISGTNFGANQVSSTLSFSGVPAVAITSWSDTKIVATVPPGASTGPVTASVNGLQSNQGVYFTVNLVISGISPTSGPVGTQVQINGSGLGAIQGTSTVAFNGTVSPVLSWGAASGIVALVPVGATTGNVVVTVNGVASNGVNFSVSAPTTPAAPSVTSVSPTSGTAGTQVTLTGSGFGESEGNGTLLLGSTLGTVVSWHNSQIVATVGTGSMSGVAQVQQGGLSSNSVPFTVSTTAIDSIAPNNGMPGTQVTISGSGFGASQGTGVVWLGTSAGIVSSWSDGHVVATVAEGSASGTAQVLQNGVWSNTVPFAINTPHITNLNPNSGTASNVVTITGGGFGSTQGSGSVWIGGALGVVTGWNDGQVMASVAANAVSGVVKIQQNGVWSNAVTFTVPPSSGSALTIMPNIISMVVGDTRSVQALDSDGQSVTGLTWTSSDTSVATLSSDDPPMITAVAPGETTISAGNASADLTVYSGTTLPVGTVIWSNPGDGSGVICIIPAVPSSTGLADVFALQTSGNVQAIATNGTVAWTANVGASSCTNLLPDFQGGLVAVNTTTPSVRKLDGMTGQSYPAYTHSNPNNPGGLPRVVVHTDGTIFTVDNNAIVVVDPTTGELKFSPISLEQGSSSDDGNCGESSPTQGSSPATVGQPIIAGDGFAYFPYMWSVNNSSSFCGSGTSGTKGHSETHSRLMRVGTDGSSSKVTIGDWVLDSVNETICSPQCAPPIQTSSGSAPVGTVLGNLITNADLGVLYSWGGCNSGYPAYSCTPQYQLTTIAGDGIASTVTTSLGSGNYVGNGAVNPVLPMLQRQDGTFVGTTSGDGIPGTMMAFDPSGNLKWSQPNDTPQIATSDNGVIGASGTTYDQNGNATGKRAKLNSPNGYQNSGGQWPGWLSNLSGDSYSKLLGAATSLASAPTIYAATFASLSGGNSSAQGTAIQQVQTNQAQGYAKQLPDLSLPGICYPPMGGLIVLIPTCGNINAIELLTNKSPAYIFQNYIQTFAPVANNPQRPNSVMYFENPTNTQSDINVTSPGQILRISLEGFNAVLQKPFFVMTERVDPADNVISAVTLQGHPLAGWRYWRVYSIGTNDVVIETGAYDQPGPGAKNYAGYYIAKGDISGGWQQYLQFIQKQLNATQGANLNNGYLGGIRLRRYGWSDASPLQGYWDYVGDFTEYILDNVCQSSSCN